MASKIYKEYVQRLLLMFEDRFDGKMEVMGMKFRNNLINYYDRFFDMFNKMEKRKLKTTKSIELLDVEVVREDEEDGIMDKIERCEDEMVNTDE